MIRNITEYLKISAEKYPDKIALCDLDNSVTFGELDLAARKLATKISAVVGNEINRPVAVCMQKSVNCIMAFSAVSYSGNFYSPIDVSSPRERIKNMMGVLSPECIITDASGESLAREICGNVPVIAMEDVSSYEKDDELIEKIAERRLNIDPIYVLFTSGSTGIPKGVVISQAGVIDYTEWLADVFAFDEHTVFGEQAPFYFDNSILDIYSTMRNGSTLVIIPESYFMFPKKLFGFLNEKSVNTIFWVPSALVGISNSGILENVKLNDLKKVLFCGEVMPTKQFNQWKSAYPNALFANLYGPTEITDVCAYYIVERDFNDDEPLPIGKACRNMEILVLNEAGEKVRGEEIGELCVRGVGLSMGYYGDTEKTQKAFVQNPLNSSYTDTIYRTGDLARYNERGELLCLGRKDSQIKHQGHRIELGEIEAASGSVEGIDSCCAVYDNSAKCIVMFYTSSVLTEKELYKSLKQCLPRYMVPGKIILRERLPLNPNGKIDRLALLKEAERQNIQGGE